MERTKDGLNSKLHAVCVERGRPRVMLLTDGQVSDYKPVPSFAEGDAATMLSAMPKAASWIRSDRPAPRDLLMPTPHAMLSQASTSERVTKPLVITDERKRRVNDVPSCRIAFFAASCRHAADRNRRGLPDRSAGVGNFVLLKLKRMGSGR